MRQRHRPYINAMKYWPITVEVDGKRIKGDWTHAMGGKLHVRSLGYGSERVDLEDHNPDRLAHQILEGLYRKDQRKRADHEAFQQNEAARLRLKRLTEDQRLSEQMAGAADPMAEAVAKLVEQIERGGFRDELGHALENNEAFIELRELLRGYGD